MRRLIWRSISLQRGTSRTKAETCGWDLETTERGLGFVIIVTLDRFLGLRINGRECPKPGFRMNIGKP